MAAAEDILHFVQQRTGHTIRADEGITFNRQRRSLSGVTVTWTADPDTIAAAAAAGHNCIVHHEALTHPYPAFTSGQERHYLSWQTNTQRLSLLAKHDLTAIRLHGSLDEAYIFNDFATQLGLTEPVAAVHDPQQWQQVFRAPVATFGELVDHVKRATGMFALRTSHHDHDRPVGRVGMPWGGLGLFVNVSYMQSLVDLGADTFICGETDNYGFRFATELDIAVIETSHEVSEVRGLRHFAADLETTLGIDVRFADTPCIWRMR